MSFQQSERDESAFRAHTDETGITCGLETQSACVYGMRLRAALSMLTLAFPKAINSGETLAQPTTTVALRGLQPSQQYWFGWWIE